MDTTQINHNNSGQKYRIAVDIAKEGSHIWDLTPYFKGRVGDNNFGLQVTWYYQGQLMNVVGMKPYIEGLVGQYSFGKNGEIDMDPDALPVSYDGSPDDCEEAGKATFYFPSQMFPQEGIFKGFIGVKDDRDGSKNPQISGVTIWFKVLPGIVQMGHACDAYVDELDKALQDFKEKLDEHDKNYQSQLQNVIDDARNAYESETQNAHDAAVAAQAELSRTREDNNNLADLIQSIENNIKANNIVTRPEYDKLANEIVNRLSQINTAPSYYNNYNDMIAANPNGTQNLCVTADNQHKWLYVNSQWLDLGNFSYADIAPDEKNSLFSSNPNNALVNPDMKNGAYGWNITAPWVLNTDNNIDNSQSYGINVQNQPPQGVDYEIFQTPIPVYKNKVLSAGVKVLSTNAESALIQVLFRDANNNIIDNAIYKEPIPQNISDWQTVKLENISIPDNAVNAAFTIVMNGTGVVNICQPIVNFESYLLPYSIKDLREQLSQDHENALVNPDMKNGAYGWNIDAPWVLNTDNNIDNSQSYGINVQNQPPQGVDYEIFQTPIPVYTHKVLSAGVKVMTDGTETATIQILFRDANSTIINNAIYKKNIPQNLATWTTVKLENVSIPDNAVSAAFTIAMPSTGVLNICQPQVNFEPFLYPYSIKEVQEQLSYNQDNALVNPDMRGDGYGWNIDAPWVLNTDNNIDNSQSYGINVQNQPPQGVDYEIYQNPIPVYKHKVLSAGVKVLSTNAESALIQVLFRDANNNAINNEIYRKLIPQNISDWQTIKLENISIPDNAVSTSFTIAMSGTGVLNICQPIVNFGSHLLPYSTKDALEQLSYNQDNALVNPDMRGDGYGWNIDAPWVLNTDNNIGNSQSYGIYVQNQPPQGVDYEIYQNPIPVYNNKVLSAGVKVMTDGTETATIQILFRDANSTVINNAIYKKNIPQNLATWTTVKLENVSIPDNAVSAAFTIAMPSTGVLNICQPQVNFKPFLYPYSFADVQDSVTEMQEKDSHKLPYFVFDTDSANVNDKWITTPFTYDDGIQELQGYAQISIQGDSSRGYPKKNYKIKIYSDADCKNKIKVRLKPSWSKLSNFNLKANFIDATQSRNLTNAHLMANATANTLIKDATVAQNLSKSQNFGQMEGFPIEVWFGDNYNGLYSCNTKKMDKVFGMDAKEKGTGVVSVLDNVSAPSSQVLRVPTAKLDNVAYADELHDTPDPELVTNWSKWLDFLNNSTDDDFKANIENYIDVNAAINIYLYGVMSREYDYESKSILFLTWNNGKYYYPIAYDLDSNWGQSAFGKIEGNPQDSTWGFSTTTSNKQDGQYVSNNGLNKLFERLYKLFKPEIKVQYLKLRSTVWRTDQILNAFKDYMDTIPETILEKDHKLWPSIPDVDKNDYGQLHSVITERCNQMDNWIEQLVPPVQPTVPASGTTPTTPASGTTPTTPASGTTPTMPAQTASGTATDKAEPAEPKKDSDK